MQLEDYFDFIEPNDIRIKGTRVGIETVLYDFIHRRRAPDEIVAQYPSLSLEQVYATITYYLHNQTQVSDYLANWLMTVQQRWEQQNLNPSPAILRLRRVAAERQADYIIKP